MISSATTPRHPWHLGRVAEVTPELAGWTHCGLRIVPIAPGGVHELATGDTEMAVLPLSGGAVTVDVDGRRFELAGRDTVFAAVTDQRGPADYKRHLAGELTKRALRLAVARARGQDL